jgi:CheY-like chemotaxis protein
VTLRVLVVDDHPAILRHVSSWVAGTGIATVAATSSSPTEVVALWSEVRPDVTLCDVHMPDIDGFQLCTQLRTEHPDAVVLLFSARDDVTMRDAAMASGASGLVSKMASSTVLADALRAATQPA